MTHFRPGPVTAMAYGGGMSAHLANIEKLSNGFIVRFERAAKIPVKKKTIDTLGFDDETKEIMRMGLAKMKEGDQWKALPEEEKAALDQNAPLEKWITTPIAIACKNEDELLEAIRSAVVAHAEIERLTLSGEFGASGY